MIDDRSAPPAEVTTAAPSRLAASGLSALRRLTPPQQLKDAVESRVDEAYKRGRDEGAEEARVAADAERQHLVEQHDAALAALREELSLENASRIAEAFSTQLTDFRLLLSDQLVTVLIPLMEHLTSEVALRTIVKDAVKMLSDCDVAAIEMSGPPELVKLAAEKLLSSPECARREPPLAIKIKDTDNPEVRIRVDNQLLETRIRQFVEVISKAVS